MSLQLNGWVQMFIVVILLEYIKGKISEKEMRISRISNERMKR